MERGTLHAQIQNACYLVNKKIRQKAALTMCSPNTIHITSERKLLQATSQTCANSPPSHASHRSSGTVPSSSRPIVYHDGMYSPDAVLADSRCRKKTPLRECKKCQCRNISLCYSINRKETMSCQVSLYRKKTCEVKIVVSIQAYDSRSNVVAIQGGRTSLRLQFRAVEGYDSHCSSWRRIERPAVTKS